MDFKPIANTHENQDYRFGQRFMVSRNGERIGLLIYQTPKNVLRVDPDRASIKATKVQDEVVVELSADELAEIASYLRDKVKEK
jgi:hypothetical protein